MQLKIKNLDAVITKEKTVTQVAQEMNVSRQTVHKWLARYKRYGDYGLQRKQRRNSSPSHNKTSYEVEQLVIQCAKEHWNDGVQTLCDWMMYEYNITLHPVTIWRILKRNNERYTTDHPRTRKKWEKQLYAHHRAGEELQMDRR